MIFANQKQIDVRAAAILTNAFVAGTVLGPTERLEDYEQLVILVSFTIGSLTTCEVKLEFSNDGVTYYQETFEDLAGTNATASLGQHQYSATGNYTIERPIKFRYVRVSAQGTGTVTSSSLTLKALLGKQVI